MLPLTVVRPPLWTLSPALMLPLTVSAVPVVRARGDADAAIDGFQVAVRLAGVRIDAAIDLVDVLAAIGGKRPRRGGEGEGDGERGETCWTWAYLVGKSLGCRADGRLNDRTVIARRHARGQVGPFATLRTCPKSLGLSPCPPASVQNPSSC